MSGIIGTVGAAIGTAGALSSLGNLPSLHALGFGGDSPVVIGTIGLDSYEVPASITFGGQQAMTVHKFPGGARVIDSMGPDNRSLDWSGIFLGVDAASRASALDAIRIAGQAVPLTWQSYSYNVVVASFEADFRNPGHIPYRISCTVLQDLSQAGQTSLISAAFQALLDLNSAIGQVSGLVQAWTASGTSAVYGLASQMDINNALSAIAAAIAVQQSVSTALNAASAALQAAGPLALGSATYTAALISAQAAQTALQAALDAAGLSLNLTAPSGSAALVNSPAALICAAVSAGTAASLAAGRGYVSRAAVNTQTGAV